MSSSYLLQAEKESLLSIHDVGQTGIDSENLSVKLGSRTSKTRGLISVLAGLLCTAINLYLFLTSLRLPYNGVRTYEEMIRLRRPNPFVGLDAYNPNWHPASKRIHTNLLTVINKSEPNRAYGEDFSHLMEYSGSVPPDDRRLVVSNQASTIAEFVTTDFRMENCELELSLPPNLQSNGSLVLGTSENVVELWLLQSTHPLYGKTVTWNNRPDRTKLIDTVKLELGTKYTYNFSCPLNSIWTFELGPATKNTHVEWTQTWIGPPPRITLFQHGSETATIVDNQEGIRSDSQRNALYNRSKPQNHKLTWSIAQPDQVVMRVTHASENYALNSVGWANQLPSGGHTIHLDEPDGTGISTHTVSLFHQLRCLEVLHDAYVDEGSHLTTRRQLSSHCMNYLRESILCMADTRNGPPGTKHTLAGYDMLCYDWKVIFEEAERNTRIFKERG